MHTIEKVGSSNIHKYHGLTSVYSGNTLHNIVTNNSIAAIGASIFGKPVGLIWALPNTTEVDTPIIDKFFVIKKFRKKGIGSSLLQEMEKDLKQKGYKKVRCVFLRLENCDPHSRNINLTQLGWDEPSLESVIFKADLRIRNAPWFNNFKVPDDYGILLWKNISDTDKKKFRDQIEKDQWYPKNLSPFGPGKGVYSKSSVGMTYKGEFVGWLMTQHVNNEIISFSHGYVKPQLQKSARYLHLITAAVKYSAENNYTKGIFTVSMKDKRMYNFIKRRFKDYTYETKEKFATYKHL